MNTYGPLQALKQYGLSIHTRRHIAAYCYETREDMVRAHDLGAYIEEISKYKCVRCTIVYYAFKYKCNSILKWTYDNERALIDRRDSEIFHNDLPPRGHELDLLFLIYRPVCLCDKLINMYI
jgi:hypothetical protein